MELGVKRITRDQKIPLDDLYGYGLPNRFKELNDGNVTFPYYHVVDKLRAVNEKTEGYLVGVTAMETLLAKGGAPTIETLVRPDDECLRDPERQFDFVLGVSERPHDKDVAERGTRVVAGNTIHVIIKVVNTIASQTVTGRAAYDAQETRTVGYLCSKELYDILDALP